MRNCNESVLFRSSCVSDCNAKVFMRVLNLLETDGSRGLDRSARRQSLEENIRRGTTMKLGTYIKFKNTVAACVALSAAAFCTISAYASETTFTSVECDKIVAMFTDEIVPRSKTGVGPYRDFTESVLYYGNLDCPTSFEFYAHTPESIEVFTKVKTQILAANLNASDLLATDQPPK